MCTVEQVFTIYGRVNVVPGGTVCTGKDGISATHRWDGTILTITSASGTSSADLQGPEGPQGPQGETGPAYTLTSADKQEIVEDVLAEMPEIPSGGGGGSSEAVLLHDITLEEETATVELELPEQYQHLFFVVIATAANGETSVLDFRFSNRAESRIQIQKGIQNVSGRSTCVYFRKITGSFPHILVGVNGGATTPNAIVFAPSAGVQFMDWNPYMTSVKIYAGSGSTAFTAGSKISVWGW